MRLSSVFSVRAAALACGASQRSSRCPPMRTGGWEPTKTVEFIVPAGTGGGADQMARLIQAIIAEAQPDEAADGRRQQGRRRRRRGLPRREGRQGRPAQDHHHAVEPVHHAARDRRAVQLEGPDAGAMLALDQFVLWVNAETPYKTAKEYIEAAKKAGPGKFKMGGTGLQAGRPDHHRRAREADRRQVHLHPVQGRRRRRGAARRQAHRLDRSTTRSRRWRSGAPASCGRCACSTTSACRTRTKVTGHDVLERHPDLQGGRASTSTT